MTINPGDGQLADADRRHLLGALTAIASCSGVVLAADAKAQSENMPRRALTGRDAEGKSVFKSIEVTPQIVTFESSPGLAFYEIYSTAGTPRVTGNEPDPMLTSKGSFPKPGGTLFRLVQFPPRAPEGTKAEPDGYSRWLAEADRKIPGMAAHFEQDTPGMHTSDTVDYGVVIKGEIILELDDKKTARLRQGDCVVQNGTRHRWFNPLPEPCLMVFVLVGALRAA